MINNIYKKATAKTTLNNEKLDAVLLRSRLLIQHHNGNSSQQGKARKTKEQEIQIGKEEIKLSLFPDDMKCRKFQRINQNSWNSQAIIASMCDIKLTHKNHTHSYAPPIQTWYLKLKYYYSSIKINETDMYLTKYV